MTAAIRSIAPRTAEQPAASVPRDFARSDRELYAECCGVLASFGMTEADRRAVVSYVRARRGEEEWRHAGRALRKQMRDKPAELAALMPLAARADTMANAMSREARGIAAQLKLDIAHRSERATTARKAKAPGVIEPWDVGDDD